MCCGAARMKGSAFPRLPRQIPQNPAQCLRPGDPFGEGEPGGEVARHQVEALGVEPGGAPTARRLARKFLRIEREGLGMVLVEMGEGALLGLQQGNVLPQQLDGSSAPLPLFFSLMYAARDIRALSG